MLASKVRQMAEIVASDSPPTFFRVTQGLRTWAEQQALYEEGRTVPGRIVTDAQPGASYHNYGLAIDIVPMTALGPDWNKTHPVWQRLISVGTSLGLTAGAQFRSFPDWPHFQLTGALPESPDANVRAVYNSAGPQVTDKIAAVWKATGLEAA